MNKIVPFAAIAVASTLSASAIPVWINELHYDNAGADTGEFVEIAGIAGTNLSGYSLHFYDGAGTVEASPISLTGFTIPNQQNGFGTLSFTRSGMENDREGIVLYNGSVLQFLSYEGAFTATNGVASGSTSTDIGIAEGTGTPSGASLGLIGSGRDYGDFTWAVTLNDTPGAVNAGQNFIAASVPEGGATLALLALSSVTLAAARRKSSHV